MNCIICNKVCKRIRYDTVVSCEDHSIDVLFSFTQEKFWQFKFFLKQDLYIIFNYFVDNKNVTVSYRKSMYFGENTKIYDNVLNNFSFTVENIKEFSENCCIFA